MTSRDKYSRQIEKNEWAHQATPETLRSVELVQAALLKLAGLRLLLLIVVVDSAASECAS